MEYNNAHDTQTKNPKEPLTLKERLHLLKGAEYDDVPFSGWTAEQKKEYDKWVEEISKATIQLRKQDPGLSAELLIEIAAVENLYSRWIAEASLKRTMEEQIAQDFGWPIDKLDKDQQKENDALIKAVEDAFSRITQEQRDNEFAKMADDKIKLALLDKILKILPQREKQSDTSNIVEYYWSNKQNPFT